MKYPTTAPHTNNGFTLVELLLAATLISIFGIFIAILAPSILQKNQTNLTARNLTDAISYAQSQSITATKQLTYGITIDPTSTPHQFIIISIDETGTIINEQTNTLSNSVIFTQPTSKQTIIFKKRTGTPTLNDKPLNTPFTIQIETPRFRTTSTINPNGAINTTPVENQP